MLLSHLPPKLSPHPFTTPGTIFVCQAHTLSHLFMTTASEGGPGVSASPTRSWGQVTGPDSHSQSAEHPDPWTQSPRPVLYRCLSCLSSFTPPPLPTSSFPQFGPTTPRPRALSQVVKMNINEHIAQVIN